MKHIYFRGIITCNFYVIIVFKLLSPFLEKNNSCGFFHFVMNIANYRSCIFIYSYIVHTSMNYYFL